MKSMLSGFATTKVLEGGGSRWFRAVEPRQPICRRVTGIHFKGVDNVT
ncbi:MULTISPECIES: hypothetical protein [Variovorax]|nr:hypothetical protein [Variovorax paradoxus]MDN6886683.1 hypothetical protein [Variovorax sp. CAN15]